MLREIHIQNLGVIEDARLELGPGLNVVTGETGAGKTMVVSGLGLLLGARADAGLVRHGAAETVVTGEVEVAPDHPAAQRASAAGGDVSDGLILVRRVSGAGRSRAAVGGSRAPVSVLTEVGERLVAVHGQADQWRLRRPEEHRAVVDHHGGAPVAACLSAYQEALARVKGLTDELARLTALAREREQQTDVLTTGLARIEAVAPQQGEDVALREESERLEHAEQLLGGARVAHDALVGGDDDDSASVADLLGAARQALTGAGGHDPRLAGLGRRVDELLALNADLASELATYLTALDADPGRLAWVLDRRGELTALTRVYGEDIDGVLAWAQQAAARLAEFDTADDRVEETQEELSAARAQLAERAAALTAARRRAADDLAARATAELRELAMGSATLEVAVEPRTMDDPGAAGSRVTVYGAHGVDEVEIRLAANKGAPARSVTRAASGGELSRLMLALEVVSASGDVPTFVFDEVDAGVGGEAAHAIGARLAELARTAQVIVVTHLAQVAAYADTHLVVHKSQEGQVTSSGVARVEGDERRAEIARMLGGVADSASAQEHARELLEQGRASRA